MEGHYYTEYEFKSECGKYQITEEDYYNNEKIHCNDMVLVTDNESGDLYIDTCEIVTCEVCKTAYYEAWLQYEHDRAEAAWERMHL